MASIGPQLIDGLDRWHYKSNEISDIRDFEYFECSFCGIVCRMPIDEYQLLDEAFVLAAQFRCRRCRKKADNKKRHLLSPCAEIRDKAQEHQGEYRRLSAEGWKDTEIARMWCIDRKTLLDKLRRWGIRDVAKPKQYPLLTPEHVQARREQGCSYAAIASEVGCSQATLYNRLHSWGVAETAATPTPEPFTEDDLPFNPEPSNVVEMHAWMTDDTIPCCVTFDDDPSRAIKMHEWMLDAEKGDFDDDVPTPSVVPAESQLSHGLVPAIDNDHLPDVKNMVDHPPHYTQGAIECIDAIEAAVQGLVGMEAVYTANVIKYNWRWKHKGGVEDLLKAQWYQARLIALVSK